MKTYYMKTLRIRKKQSMFAETNLQVDRIKENSDKAPNSLVFTINTRNFKGDFKRYEAQSYYNFSTKKLSKGYLSTPSKTN